MSVFFPESDFHRGTAVANNDIFFFFPFATNSDSIFLVTFMLTLTLSKTLFHSNS